MVGALHEDVIDSQALTGNPLGDPHQRPILIWTPPGYDEEPQRRYPTIYRLQGFTGQVDMWRNRSAFRLTPIEAADAAFAVPGATAAILVYVDAWTSLGGSQFLDSPAIGRYHTYLCEDVVGWVDRTFRTLATAEHRGLAGHSSGGYGAMVSAMLRPDLFSAFATHSGDALFEVGYLPDAAKAARVLRDRYEGSLDRFLAAFREHPDGLTAPHEGDLLNLYAMSACYAADADGTVNLPFEPTTGRLRPDVWDRFLAWDPVRMVERYADALHSMRAIWIDAGRSDEYNLDLGAQAFRNELERIGMDEGVIQFELFEGRHGGVDWRYPLALTWLAERLA
jgi:S-formylglutathione hydrolase FrmB